jgi:hypothetical protein
MTTKEQIQADVAQAKQNAQKPSWMSKLKSIKINAPEDFATRLDKLSPIERACR